MSRFHNLTGIGIEDETTGHIYNNKAEITNLLNKINDSDDRNNDILHSFKEYLMLKTLQLEEEDPNNELETYKHLEAKLREMMRTI